VTPAERREFDALKAKLAAVERRVGDARGLGVNTTFGATHHRTTQLGFAAELTAAWDATDGYAWKRLRLEAVALTDPGVQLTGTGAVTPAGDETLEAGTPGWMEPSPDGTGYVFTPDPGAGAAAACQSMLVGLDPQACLTGTVRAGTEGCTTVEGATVYLTYDAGAGTGTRGGWVSSAFTTADGDTTVTVFLDAQGDVRATIVGESEEEQYLTPEGCVNGRLRFSGSDCLWCGGEWERGCGKNRFYVEIACGCTIACAACPGLVGTEVVMVNNEGYTLSGTWVVVDGKLHLALRSAPNENGESPFGADITCDPDTGLAYYDFDPENVVTVTPVGDPGAPTTLTFQWDETESFTVECGESDHPNNPCGTGSGPGTGGPDSGCGRGFGSPDLTMTVVGGADAGAYVGSWVAGSPDYVAFELPVTGTVVFEYFGGAWHLVWNDGDVQDEEATGGTCDPFAIDFDGASFGASSLSVAE
jgi:hypothetical protein